MADVTILAGGGAKPNTRQYTVRLHNISDALSVDVGDPVVLFDEVVLSDANAAATANCLGIAVSAGEQSPDGTPGGFIDAQFAGPCALTAAQWDRVTGQTGGLTPHSVYYIDWSAPGKLTTTDPFAGGHFKTVVGFALNPTTMMLQIQPTQSPPA